MNKIERLPDTELEVMQAVWKNSTPISTKKVKEYLDTSRAWNISALQTLLNRLIARGFISSEKQGKNRYYKPIISESEYLAKENKSFLERINGSSITKLVTSLYDSEAITNSDLELLAAFIEEKTRGMQ